MDGPRPNSNPPSSTLFVRNLAHGSTVKDVEDMFSNLPGYVTSRHRIDKSQCPVAFVEFESSECAGRALDTNNGCLMRNKPLFVEFAKEKRPRTDISQPAQRDNLPLEKRMKGADPSRERVKIATLEVMGIPGDASLREISHLFRPFPGFRQLRASTSSPAHIVEFDSRAQAEVAIQALEDYMFDRMLPNSRLHLVLPGGPW